MPSDYDTVKSIAMMCDASASVAVFSRDIAEESIAITGIVNGQETKRSKKKEKEPAIKATNSQHEVLMAACKMVYGTIPGCFIIGKKLDHLEASLIRFAQLKSTRR